MMDEDQRETAEEEELTPEQAAERQAIEDLRFAVRYAYDLQKLRMQQGNRGSRQAAHADAQLDEGSKVFMVSQSDKLKGLEKEAFREVKRLLKPMPIWTEWLDAQKGVGPAMAGVLVSEIDVTRSNTVSQMWSYCGLAVRTFHECSNCDGTELGRALDLSLDCPFCSGVLETLQFQQESTGRVICSACDAIFAQEGCAECGNPMKERGESQRRAKGQKANFNPWLKSKLVTVLGGCLIKANSQPWRKFYDDYKRRKQNQRVPTCMLCKGAKKYEGKTCSNCEGKGGNCAWGRSDAHRHAAAQRYMVKMFLAQFWEEWRKLKGLPVRPPYAEEYLGRKHAA